MFKSFYLFFSVFIIFMNNAFAADGAKADFDYFSLLPFVAMALIFYFLVIRPTNKKQQEQDKLQSSIKKGMLVLTSAGLVGRVEQISSENKFVKLATSEAAYVSVILSTVVEVIDDKNLEKFIFKTK